LVLSFALMVGPAAAIPAPSLQNCPTFAGCGFGFANLTDFADPNTGAVSFGGPAVNGISVDGVARETSAGIFTYVYRVTAGTTAITQLDLFTDTNVNLFDVGSYGTIDDLSNGGVTADFQNLASVFRVLPSGLVSTDFSRVLGFYGQSTFGPGEGGFTVIAGQTGSGTTTLAQVPEPGSLLLLGVGSLLAAPWLRARCRSRR
jgi:hypothetical protein